MVELRFAHLQDTREMHQGELWLTKETPTFPEPRPDLAPSQPLVVVILSPDDVNNDPDSLDIQVAPLSAQVTEASALDLKLDLSQDVQFDHPDDRAVMAQDQIIELWNDQSLLKINLDRRLGLCSELVKDRIKQVLRWSYGVESCAEVPAWVSRPIADADDPRLRFQDQERETTRYLRDSVEQLYRLLMADEEEESEEESVPDTTEEAEDRAAFDAWQEEILRENYERDERLSRFLRDNLGPEELAVLRGPCPDTPTFVAYQQGDLPVERAEAIQQHVVFCRACLEELVALGWADEVDYDPERDYAAVALPPALRQEFLRRASEVEQLFSTGQKFMRQESWADAMTTFRALLCIAPNHPKAKESLLEATISLEFPEAPPVQAAGQLVRECSEPWHPVLAGELVAAAGARPQQKTFQLGDGNIRVTCEWQAAAQNQPAVLRVGWQARLARPGDLWVRFTRLEDPTDVLAEVQLGSALADAKVFTAHALGFDPTRVPWALTLLLKEPQG